MNVNLENRFGSKIKKNRKKCSLSHTFGYTFKCHTYFTNTNVKAYKKMAVKPF